MIPSTTEVLEDLGARSRGSTDHRSLEPTHHISCTDVHKQPSCSVQHIMQRSIVFLLGPKHTQSAGETTQLLLEIWCAWFIQNRPPSRSYPQRRWRWHKWAPCKYSNSTNVRGNHNDAQKKACTIECASGTCESLFYMHSRLLQEPTSDTQNVTRISRGPDRRSRMFWALIATI